MPVTRSLEDHQANCLQVLRATLAKNISEHAAELSAALNIERRYLVEANFARLLGFVRNDSQLSRARIILSRVSASSRYQAIFQLTESVSYATSKIAIDKKVNKDVRLKNKENESCTT